MNLIDTYIEQVGDNLPRKDRDDILKEIRSILEDTLESRSLAEGKAVDEAMTVAVLKEFGTPKKVASAYLPARYLIGPRLYPTFLLVTKVALGIVLLVGIVTTTVTMFQQPMTIDAGVKYVIEKLMEMFGSMLSILGNLVFIFAIVEWAMSHDRTEKDGVWDPRSLIGKENRDVVKPWSQVPDIILTMIALLLFNVFASRLGFTLNDASGNPVFFPAISGIFYRYLPWLNLIWILSIILNLVLIRLGKWQTWIRWSQIALDICGTVILVLMVTGPSIIAEPTGNLASMGSAGAQVAGIYSGIAIGIKALLIVLIFVPVIELIEYGVNLVREKGLAG